MRTKTMFYTLLLIAVVTATGCAKNYYSGTGKGSKCGCPSTR
ncbi:MAG TPA: hypothetical protein VHK69_21695 [Chitinophagaceae bacterium]|jgi:hypothetical protein|nr:hypothetical protein [Chitinophagaceae bacterium]